MASPKAPKMPTITSSMNRMLVLNPWASPPPSEATAPRQLSQAWPAGARAIIAARAAAARKVVRRRMGTAYSATGFQW